MPENVKVSALPTRPPATWAANTAFDARAYPDVEFQFTSGTVTVTRSLDGTNYVTWWTIDKDFAFASSAATPGIYSTQGSAWLKFSADVTVRAGS